ncbi:cytidine deaminase family protein [Chromobacterium violaceum]|uniref:cytidine deaminase family protein n=1 Tax=Chromobacterium violaceum TaxID=536 RepID=UPI001B34452F|nr:hypothetical protein [Chromobacterium violaceum]MBP4043948.1 hypothetical protein [Chromobacterium violaceum]
MKKIPIDWNRLSISAWKARENAFLIGKTAVGAALITENGKIYTGCNVEHRYRVMDIHAELNAISNMINEGERSFQAILVAAERPRFTPCGSCMDWIFQFGGSHCLIGYQSSAHAEIIIHSANELMPFYPE